MTRTRACLHEIKLKGNWCLVEVRVFVPAFVVNGLLVDIVKNRPCVVDRTKICVGIDLALVLYGFDESRVNVGHVIVLAPRLMQPECFVQFECFQALIPVSVVVPKQWKFSQSLVCMEESGKIRAFLLHGCKGGTKRVVVVLVALGRVQAKCLVQFERFNSFSKQRH